MSTTIVYANTSDGWLSSTSTVYSTARAGANFAQDTTSNALYWAQQKSGSNFTVNEAFIEWPYSISSTEQLMTCVIRCYGLLNNGTSFTRALEMRSNDWGGSVTSADWETATSIGGETRYFRVANAQASTNKYIHGGHLELVDRVYDNISPLRVIVYSNRFYFATTPTTDENSAVSSANESGTTFDPALIYSTVPYSRLVGVLGAQAQLSDGSHVYIEAKDEVGADAVLKHRTTGGTVTTIYDLDYGTNGGDFQAVAYGMQQTTLVVDASDNIYCIAAQGSTANALVCKAFAKGVGYTWTAKTTLAAPLTAVENTVFSSLAAAWHNIGTNGTIMVAAMRCPGNIDDADAQYALLNCQAALAGSGTLLRGSGNARGVVVSNTTNSGNFSSYVNETGNALDVVALSSIRGVVICTSPEAGLGSMGYGQAFRYTLDSNGTSITNSGAPTFGATGTPYLHKDAGARARVLRISGTLYAHVTCNNVYGIQVSFWQNASDVSGFTHMGTAYPWLNTNLIGNGTALMDSGNWDVLYDPASSKIYIYYFSILDDRRLMRTGVDVNTYQADGIETQVSAAVGASGSANFAIRVNRGATNAQQVLVCVSNKTSGGTHSTQYVADQLNAPPNAPTLTPKANYDATGAATFAWTFSDPNAGDTQTAYEMQIVDTSTGTATVSTGKVSSTTSSRNVTANTLTNAKNYQWRVRTWDTQDAVGAYSAYSTFSTSAGGTVTITDPASDNPAGVNSDDYLVKWSVSGTTQNAYRVVVTRTSDSSTLVNTGWVTSVATQYLVSGMLTNVEYNVAVTVRNVSNVESGTGNRKITLDYDNVPKPGIMVTASEDGYILIEATNPAPSGDDPAATANEIYRRVNGDTGPWVKIATIAVDDEYRDYTAASGVVYQYLIRATAP